MKADATEMDENADEDLAKTLSKLSKTVLFPVQFVIGHFS